MTIDDPTTIAGAIIVGLGGVAGVLRWGVQRITKVIESNSATMLKFVETAARLEVKLDQAHAASQRTADAVEAIAEESSGVHQTPGWKTPPQGTSTAYLHVKRKAGTI